MRARDPDDAGFVEREGVRIHWESFGHGDTTVLLAPTWSIIPSRFWKLQVPHLARRYRVITFDGRGTGLSDAPTGAEAYTHHQFAADLGAVLDALDVDRAVLVGLSCGATWTIQYAADHPERVSGVVSICPAVPLAPGHPERHVHAFDEPLDTDAGWAKYNALYWRRDHRDYRDFLEFFFGEMFHEPHSTKQIEDCVAWGLDVDPEVLVDSTFGLKACGFEQFSDVCRRVTAPVLVIHGDEDRIRTYASGVALAEATGGELVTIAGGGHGPQARDPVLVNRLIERFVDRVHGRSTRRSWTVAHRRPRRVLYLSSPIGLGHARRDAAIADELRRLHPDVEIHWLAQHPVTALLDHRGEHVHPGSALLVSESAHIEDEADEHDLHAFQAIRDMDEILVSNFMVFDDVVTEGHYDLVIGDEAWEVDHFLHENPAHKRFAYAWLTDFVGWLPMPDGGDRERCLTADYNLEMIEQRSRYRRLRDASIFVGDPDDIIPCSFGDGLPDIREWTTANYEFAGYVTGFEPLTDEDRMRVRDELGFGSEPVCVVTVGGSGVGVDLLRRVVDAVPAARRLVDDMRFEVVVGPRIDPRSLPRRRGVRYRTFVPDLHRLLAASDVAVVHGGLTTTMELVANGRPFVYVPLQHHFEQHFHVHHRLQRHGAGRRLEYPETVDPDHLAELIVAELDRPVDYRPVSSDGAARAAAMLAALL